MYEKGLVFILDLKHKKLGTVYFNANFGCLFKLAKLNVGKKIIFVDIENTDIDEIAELMHSAYSICNEDDFRYFHNELIERVYNFNNYIYVEYREYVPHYFYLLVYNKCMIRIGIEGKNRKIHDIIIYPYVVLTSVYYIDFMSEFLEKEEITINKNKLRKIKLLTEKDLFKLKWKVDEFLKKLIKISKHYRRRKKKRKKITNK